MVIQKALDAFCTELIDGEIAEFGIEILVQNRFIARDGGGLTFPDFICCHPFFSV